MERGLRLSVKFALTPMPRVWCSRVMWPGALSSFIEKDKRPVFTKCAFAKVFNGNQDETVP